MAKLVGNSEYDKVIKLKESIENDEIQFKSYFDKAYASDCVEQFLHYWNQLQITSAKHCNDICTKTIKNLRNVGLFE